MKARRLMKSNASGKDTREGKKRGEEISRKRRKKCDVYLIFSNVYGLRKQKPQAMKE